jgi:hypothetical protein
LVIVLRRKLVPEISHATSVAPARLQCADYC